MAGELKKGRRMNTELADLRDKKALFFHGNLSVAGGSEKITVKEA